MRHVQIANHIKNEKLREKSMAMQQAVQPAPDNNN